MHRIHGIKILNLFRWNLLLGINTKICCVSLSFVCVTTILEQSWLSVVARLDDLGFDFGQEKKIFLFSKHCRTHKGFCLMDKGKR
jgi:hypothetical protein